MLTRREYLTLAAGGFMAGCGTPTKQAGPVRKMRLAVLPHPTFGPPYLAKEKGFFAAEGLDVELVPFVNTTEALPLLSEGKLDGAFGAFSGGLVNVIVRSGHIRIVAARGKYSRGCGDNGALYLSKARFSRGAEDREAWKGARVAIPGRATHAEFLIDQVLKSLGLPEDAIIRTVMRQEASLAAAAAGQVDVLTGVARPGQARPEVSAKFQRSDLGERTLPDFQYSYTMFGASLLGQDPDPGIRLLRAYQKAVKAFVEGETPAFFAELAKKLDLDYEQLRQECRLGTSVSGEIREENLQAMVDWAVAKKDVEQRVEAKQLIDGRFLAGMRRQG